MNKLSHYFLVDGVKKGGIAIAIGIALALLDFETLSFLSFLYGVYLLVAYRKPRRYGVLLDGKGVVSPVDGRLQKIEEDLQSYKLTIESAFLDAGVLYAPIDGEVEHMEYQNGTRLPKHSLLFEKLNEEMGIKYRLGNNSVEVVHRLKRSLLPLQRYTKIGQKHRCGEIVGFGSQTVTQISLPKGFRLNLHPGDRLKGSETILGYFDTQS